MKSYNNKEVFSKNIDLLLKISFGISLIFWFLSFLRHYLLQSNAFDLGLFDQWIWLESVNQPAYSSMTGLHLLADHGAWILYLPVLFYKIYPSVHWLFVFQSTALVFTSLPIWLLSKQRDLSNKECWLICSLWWLQPVVFNVNLFDFHPEVMAMPLLALSYYFLRQNNRIIWLFLLFVVLGTRDGLVLLTIGISLEQLLRGNVKNFALCMLLSITWLGFLNNFLYPYLNADQGTIMAISRYAYLGNSLKEILLQLISNPLIILSKLEWSESIFYLFILFIPFVLFINKDSLITSSAIVPLLLTNILSTSFSQRTLIHHYSLPIVLVLVIASIDAFSFHRSHKNIFKFKYLFLLFTWAALSKPWFFLGPYLSRTNSIKPAREAFSMIPKNAAVLTTSYLAPHLTQRKTINFPKENFDKKNISNYDVLLLNPLDPGWESNKNVQNRLLSEAKNQNWVCESWDNGLELCQRN